MPNPMRSFCLAPGVAWRRISDEIVVLKLDTGEYYSLPQAAAQVWEWLVEGLDEAALATRLHQNFDVPSRRADKDLKDFIEDALSEKLLSPSNTAKSPSAAKAPARKRAYSRLALKKHSTLDPKFYAMATY